VRRHRQCDKRRRARRGSDRLRDRFKLAGVRTVWAALPEAHKPNASWLMSPSAFASLANLTDTAGGLVLPTLHTENPTLYSRPVLVSPKLPAAAANARSVVVGDFQAGYAVRRVRGGSNSAYAVALPGSGGRSGSGC
jgi:HK97 family phage major capsid protein